MPRLSRLSSTALAVCGLLVLLWQIAMVLHREFNWDEYYFLTLVFQYRQGTLEQALQTFHVHLFYWLTDLPWSDSDRIVAGRSVMLLLHLATLFFLYGATRRLISAVAASWAVILYASLQFVLVHATSFRADPLITFLLVGALYLLAVKPLHLSALVASSLAIGLAGLISVKSVTYLPLITALVVFQWSESPEKYRDAKRIAAAVAISLLVVAGAFYMHCLTLKASVTDTAHAMTSIADKQFSNSTLFAGLRFLLVSMSVNSCFYLLVAVGMVIALAALFGKGQLGKAQAALILVFASPILLSLLYRNSFPYFYVFMSAPVAMVAGFAAGKLQKYWGAFALLAATSVIVTLPAFQRGQEDQRRVEAAVHQMFPQPVAYIDRCGMISSFPLANFFMSSWGLDNYIKAGEPVLAKAIASRHPAFLLATHPVIEVALGLPPSAPTGGYELLPDDARALAGNYVHFWGPIWVAGKQLPSSQEGVMLNMLIAGVYTFDAPSPGVLDGRPITPGTVVRLREGPHTYSGPAAKLRYGENLIPPAEPSPKPFFVGF